MKPQHWPVSKVLPCCPSRCKTACPPRKTLLEHGTVQWNLRRMARIGEGTEFWGKSRGKIGHERLKHKNFRDPRTDEILKPHVILVGGIPTPLKNMTSSIGTIIPNIWKKSISKPPTSIVYYGLRTVNVGINPQITNLAFFSCWHAQLMSPRPRPWACCTWLVKLTQAWWTLVEVWLLEITDR